MTNATIADASETREARLVTLRFVNEFTQTQAENELAEYENHPEKLARLDERVRRMRAAFQNIDAYEAQTKRNAERERREAIRAQYLEPVTEFEVVFGGLECAIAAHMESAERLLDTAQRVQAAIPHGESLPQLTPRALATRIGEDLLRMVAGDQTQLREIVATNGKALLGRLHSAAPTVKV